MNPEAPEQARSGQFGKLSRALNLWFSAYLDGKNQSKLRRETQALAEEILKGPGPGTDDTSTQAWGWYLARAVKASPSGFGRGASDSELVAMLVRSNRRRILIETPLALCLHCGLTAEDGGGPLCDCSK